MQIPFTKMQAYGNDYVYVDVTRLPEEPDWNDAAIRISDRHFGVGSDGLILVCPSKAADFRMRVFDPDGTEAEMCGNALRSVGRFVYDHRMTAKTDFTVETLGGIKHVPLTVGEQLWINQSVPYKADGKGVAIPINSLTLPMLKSALQTAIDEERYEDAKALKAEIDRRS